MLTRPTFWKPPVSYLGSRLLAQVQLAMLVEATAAAQGD